MVLDLEVMLKEKNKFPLIELEGEVDVYTYPKLAQIFKEVFEKYPKISGILLHLEKVKYIDSTGLGVMANCANQIAKASNGRVLIINPTPQLRKIFNVSGLLSANFGI